MSGSGSGLEKFIDPYTVCPERFDPDLVFPERLDPDPVNIRPDPKPCYLTKSNLFIIKVCTILFPFTAVITHTSKEARDVGPPVYAICSISVINSS